MALCYLLIDKDTRARLRWTSFKVQMDFCTGEGRGKGVEESRREGKEGEGRGQGGWSNMHALPCLCCPSAGSTVQLEEG